MKRDSCYTWLGTPRASRYILHLLVLIFSGTVIFVSRVPFAATRCSASATLASSLASPSRQLSIASSRSSSGTQLRLFVTVKVDYASGGSRTKFFFIVSSTLSEQRLFQLVSLGFCYEKMSRLVSCRVLFNFFQRFSYSSRKIGETCVEMDISIVFSCVWSSWAKESLALVVQSILRTWRILYLKYKVFAPSMVVKIFLWIFLWFFSISKIRCVFCVVS